MDLLPAIATLPLLSLTLSVASAIVFLLVARTVWTRPVSQESVRARNAFVVWWVVLGGVTLASLALRSPIFTQDVQTYLAFTVVVLGLLCIGLWGLLFYLVYLFTNRRGLALPMALGYAVYFVILTAFVLSGDPTGIEDTPTGPRLEYADPIDSGPIYWAVVLLLVLPPFLAAGGYLSLYWKVDRPEQKRRILLVSVSILVWFGSSLVGIGAGTSESTAWSLVSRIISLAAALTIYYAYRYLRPSEPAAATLTPKAGTEPPLYGAPPRKGVSNVVNARLVA